MENKILLQKNADVLTPHGKTIGSLERVVLNPETKVVTDIVVRLGVFFDKEEKVVPVDLVADTTEHQIILSYEAGELDDFPPFEEKQVVAEDGDKDHAQSSEAAPPVIFGYAGAGLLTLPEPSEQIVTKIEQNIPKGTVAMKEGAKVLTAEGKHVGNVERVLADPSVDQVTHLLISRGLLIRELKLIPIKWVMKLGEDIVHLRVKKASVEDLNTVPIAG